MIPNNLYEKYYNERVALYNLLEKLNDAVLALASGSVSSYSLGNRSVSYTDLDKIKALRKETEGRIEELEGLLSGRSARNVTVSTYLDPSTIMPRRRW